MFTKEEILNNEHTMYVSQSGTASINPKEFPLAYRQAAINAMDKYTRQKIIAFTNSTTRSECQYSCSDEDQWNNIHNPQESITTEQLVEIFIEQQNRP